MPDIGFLGVTFLDNLFAMNGGRTLNLHSGHDS